MVERNSFFRTAAALTSLSFALASLAGTDATSSNSSPEKKNKKVVKGVGGGLVKCTFLSFPSFFFLTQSERQ